MANENLVSTVYFRGTVNGVASLDIIDTSVPPDYTVTYDNRGHQVNDPTKALDIKPGRDLVIELQQVPVSELVNKVYVRLTGAQAVNFTMSNVMGMTDIGNGGKTGTVNISPTGYGKVNAILTNYPSRMPSDANIEFFHDVGLTQKFLTVPLKSLPVTRPRLTITTLRESPRATTGVYNNDTMVVLYEDDTNQNNHYLTVLPYKLFVDNVEITQDVYPDTGVNYFKGTVSTLLGNFGMGSKGASTNVRQKNLVSPGNKTIKVTMGSIEATVPLLDSDTGILVSVNANLSGGAGQVRVENFLPGTITSTDDPNLSMAFGFYRTNYIPPTPPTGIPLYPREPVSSYMECMIALRYIASPKALALGGDGTITDNFVAGKVARGYSKGRLTALSWDTRTLTTAKSREQFGKFQASFSTIFKWQRTNMGGVMVTIPKYESGMQVITMTDINNPVATAQYGALTKINLNEVAIFAFATRDGSISDLSFGTSVNIMPLNSDWDRFLIEPHQGSNTPTLPPDTTSKTDKQVRIDSLFIRTNKENEINQFSPDTPYPRILNVQSKVGIEAFVNSADYSCVWEFSIDPSLGIDMTNPRYTFLRTIQQNGIFGADLDTGQEQTIHTLSATKAIFRSGWVAPKSTMCIALVDLGPGTPPINSTFKFKAVNLPKEGSYVVNNGAGTFETAKYGNENLIVAKGVIGGLYCKILTIVNKHTNAAAIDPGSWQNYVALEFYTDDSYTTVDSFSSKPTALKATFRGRTIPLTRANYNSQPITNSYHFYSLQAMDATHTNLQAWRSGMAESIGIETDITIAFN